MPWDRELHVLEEAIRRLNGEYDAFLYGSGARPPVESRKHVEQMIRQLNATTPDSAADRYRFATLQGRFNAFCERWDRLLEEKEAGRRPGLYGHFASAGSTSVSAPLNARRAASVPEEAPSKGSQRELFARYVAAKQARGENVGGYRFDQFVESLNRERDKLRERFGTGEIVFDVIERDGRVRLVARHRREGGK